MKTCRKCGETKPPELFRPNPRLKDGLSSWCRDCQLAATRRWRAENRDAINQRRREQYALERDRPVFLVRRDAT